VTVSNKPPGKGTGRKEEMVGKDKEDYLRLITGLSPKDKVNW
jgi:hypothetical protein